MIKPLVAGACQAEITPKPGVRLAGYPHFNRENLGAHDPLYCCALYLNNGEEEMVFVTLDILFYSKQYTEYVRTIISYLTGIKPENINITCSHTHSGPWAAGNPELKGVLLISHTHDGPNASGETGELAEDGDDGKDRDPEYIDFLRRTIIDTITKAKANAVPAEVGMGFGICGKEVGVGGNRTSPDGPADPSVNVLCIRDLNHKVLGAIVNYALHPTFLHEDSEVVSADYPAYIRLKICEKFQGACMGFAQGTSGDQSSRYFRQGQSFDEAKRVGDLMGEVANNVIETMKYETEVVLAHASTELPIEIRKYPSSKELEKNVEQKTKEYQEALAANRSYLDVQNANLRLLGAEDSLGYARKIEAGEKIDLRDEEGPCEINAYRIGDSAIVSFQGEAFVSFGLKIKELSQAKNTFVFELSNGCMPGYCCDAAAYETQGYEAGNSMLVPDYGDKVVAAAKKCLNKVFD